MLVFDIETGPLPVDYLESLITIPEFVPLPAFDPSTVKLGNIKDEMKRREKIESSRLEYITTCKSHAEKHESDIIATRQTFVDRAALCPTTGQVLAIGYTADGVESAIDGAASPQDEPHILKNFWNVFQDVRKKQGVLVGYNINGFDLPFIVRRSWLHGVEIPQRILEKDRYWSPVFVDLANVWKLGSYSAKMPKLDDVCKFFGLPGKNGSGADFARLWTEDRPTAVAYLQNDVQQTHAVAVRMGVK